jgi:hypothetical protein
VDATDRPAGPGSQGPVRDRQDPGGVDHRTGSPPRRRGKIGRIVTRGRTRSVLPVGGRRDAWRIAMIHALSVAMTWPGVGDQGQMVAIEDRLTAFCP